MKKIQLILRIVVVFVLTVSVLFQFGIDQAWATGQFSTSCTNITIKNSEPADLSTIGEAIISASCQKNDGSFVDTSIDINPYIGNLDGTMSWTTMDNNKNNFALSCYDLVVSPNGNIAGMCLKDTKRIGGKIVIPNPREVQTSINLDDHIANIDGTLKYE